MHLISLKSCQSPKSAVEGATSGGTKLTAALVHGFGESAYYYWAADQVCHIYLGESTEAFLMLAAGQ